LKQCHKGSIIFSEGQGVDGFFKTGEVGFSVKSVMNLIGKIDLIIENYETISEIV
jgi:hypothetical protein